jgi:ABC-type transport system involved in cytochrome c biogenesis ATPase subunit
VPKKLQIKLLSDAGELLNVVTCSIGTISVFRAHSAADLRPYQRALAGVPTKERFVITVDGDPLNYTNHALIGFGDGPFKSSASTREHLIENGCSEESVDGLLMSFGLERYADAPLSTLPADEERRVRILVATLHPEQALIINEPFEPISSQWRERAADILAASARSTNALIVVPSLSYRPEAWIDNQAVARIQVGQTLQRTIGFGAAGSAANSAMDELKNKLRAEMADETESSASALSAAAIAPILSTETSTTTTPQSSSPHSPHAIEAGLRKSFIPMKALVATTGVIVAGAGLYAVIAPQAGPAAITRKIEATSAADPTSATNQQHPDSSSAIQQPADTELAKNGVAPQPTTVPPERVASFVLDFYPDSIRDSLLATVRGVSTDPSAQILEDVAAPVAAVTKNNPGNIFNLLEQASSSENGQGNIQQQWNAEPMQDDQPQSWSPLSDTSEDPVEAEQRREEIRQKFLEAIRAAAERRESEMASDQ